MNERVNGININACKVQNESIIYDFSSCSFIFLGFFSVYTGRVFTNFLVRVFNCFRDWHIFMSFGVTFQSLMASLTNVFSIRVEPPISIGLFSVMALVLIVFRFTVWFWIFNVYP